MKPRLYVLPLLLLILNSCGLLGLAPATNFTTRYAYAAATYTGVTNRVADALKEKRITVDDAKSYRTVAREWRRGMDVARTVYETGDLQDATARLELTIIALEQLQGYLDAHARKQAKPKPEVNPQ